MQTAGRLYGPYALIFLQFFLLKPPKTRAVVLTDTVFRCGAVARTLKHGAVSHAEMIKCTLLAVEKVPAIARVTGAFSATCSRMRVGRARSAGLVSGVGFVGVNGTK